MSKTLKTLAAAALCFGLSSPLWAEELSVESVVATVNGVEITLGEMLLVRESLPEQYQTLPDEVLWDALMDQLIQQEALAQDDKAAENARTRAGIANETRAIYAAETLRVVLADAVTEETIQQSYQTNIVEAAGTEYNASHILVETQEEAATIAGLARDGGDFEALAKEHSTGPSGPNGGSLGWFARGMMVEAFQDAVEGMEVGGVSDPVETQFGWHVIKLNETREQEPPALEDVKTQVAQELQQEAVRAYLTIVTEAAEVTRVPVEDVDPTVLSKPQLFDQ